MRPVVMVEPVSGTLGAVVRGVDLSETLDESIVAEIREAFLAHHVLFFSDQDLSPEAQLRFGRYFGAIDTHPFVEAMEAHPEVIESSRSPTTGSTSAADGTAT
jgi:taurine dioxygenase